MQTLKIVPCPEHAGKHPLHDARYIMTADADVELDPIDGWCLESGAIVATMRDCQDQQAYARLFAASPQLLGALEMILNLTQYGDAFLPDVRKICTNAIRLAKGQQ